MKELTKEAQTIFNNYGLTPFELLRLCELYAVSSIDIIAEPVPDIIINKLSVNTEDIPFSNRLLNIFAKESYKTVSDIVAKRKIDFERTYGLGADCVKEIENYLKNEGLSFEMQRACFWYEKQLSK